MRKNNHPILVGLVLVILTWKIPISSNCKKKSLPIIPKPVQIEYGLGEFCFARNTPLILPKNADENLEESAKLFAEKVKKRFNASIYVISPSSQNSTQYCKASILLGDVISNCGLTEELPKGDIPKEEGYKISTGESILVYAETDHGYHNAFMTILQSISKNSLPPSIPAFKIIDYPRFSWRGMLLDPARNFLPKDVIKKYIDILSELKLNVLHWHLVDDQGWRIESKRFPKLHQVGGKDGYYTQEELKEIVNYASIRYVMIVPEIDIPGHSSAMQSAYPELNCFSKPVPVRKGPGIYPTALCPGKEEVYEFLEELFREIGTIFPAKYVHIGSDEVIAIDWLDYPPNKELMKQYGYKDKKGLQIYFVKRVYEILTRQEKTMIAWDEITDYLPEKAIVQAWRDQDLARVAAEKGNDAIISPTSHCYIDYPALIATLKKLYLFEPIPQGLSPDLYYHILGGEVNLWGERVVPSNIDRKAFPRVIAHSEVMWSKPEQRDYKDFLKRLDALKKDMKKRGIKFGRTWRHILVP